MVKNTYLFFFSIILLLTHSCIVRDDSSTTALSIVALSPENQATGLSILSTISVQFSESIDKASVNSNTFQLQILSIDGIYSNINGMYSFGTDMKSIALTPTKNLEYNKTYRVIITAGESGIMSSSHQKLSSSPEWWFQTVSGTFDSDNDGLNDMDELSIYHTDPYNTDTDGDGLNDFAEILTELDPNNAADVSVVDDPLYTFQWHLNNHLYTPGEDVNVEPVWAIHAGSPEIVVAVVDSGVEATHPDLKDNLELSLSWHYQDQTSDPTPHLDQDDPYHGTACAGIIAARGWNNIGVKGVAPFTKLAGLNVFSTGVESDFQNALAQMGVHISSNSWGPSVSWTLEEWADIDFVEQGIVSGRDGKGIVYIFAAGNDGFNANNSSNVHSSRYTITVSAVDEDGVIAPYSNYGSNILVTAPGGSDPYIMTTDYTGTIYGYPSSETYSDNLNGDYTDNFSGTSAATPMVAGVVALLLQANPELTYRDVKYILATTARKNDPSDSGWNTVESVTPVHEFNPFYGFGIVDAMAAVSLARAFVTLGEEKEVSVNKTENASLTDNGTDTFAVAVTQSIIIEHIDIKLSLNHANIGDLEIELESPRGTISKVAFCKNIPDYAFTCESSWSSYDYNGWNFGSERHLDENSQGTWVMRVTDTNSGSIGTLTDWHLQFYGH